MLMINVVTKKANFMLKHGRQLVYLCHCSFNACNPVGVSRVALLFFLGP